MPARRRGQTEGSIFRRKDGRWCAMLDLGRSNGRRKRKSYFGKTRQQVHERLIKALRETQLGIPQTTEQQTLKQFVTDWLENSVKSSVRPRTYQSYELLSRLHILPDLGPTQLTKLSPQHVQRLLEAKSKSGLSAQTVRHIRTVLRRAIGQAMKWGLVARNVAALVDPPRLVRHRFEPPNAAQAQSLLSKAKGDRLEALYVLALSVGLRRGELLGLRWSDIDLDNGRVAISQAIQRLKGEGLKASDPKTDRSRRVVALPQVCAKALRSWRVRQLEERLAAGTFWRDSGLVFTSHVGTPLDPRNLHRKFKSLLKRASLSHRIRFHDLRHACASYLLSQGVALRTISDLLGHSGIAVTADIYAHVAPQMLKDAANKMDGLFAEL